MPNIINPLEGLNEQQQDVVVAPDDKPVLVMAGPGSGKTRLMAHRVTYLVNNLDYAPNSIVVTTFTKRAAEELRKRCSAIMGAFKAKKLNIGTIHALCLRILREEGYEQDVARDYQVKRIIQDAMRASRHNTHIIQMETDNVGWGFVHHWLMAAKLNMIPADGSKEWFESRILMAPTTDSPAIAYTLAPWLEDCYVDLEKGMADRKIIDFADMLRYCMMELEKERVAAKWQGRFKQVLLDECQDTSHLQLQILETLASNKYIFIVGDHDQSIYTWRGAHPANIIEFLKRHPDGEVYPLEVNYRSSQIIIHNANSLVQNAYQTDEARQYSKTVRPTDNAPEGMQIMVRGFPDDDSEARFVAQEITRLIKEEGYQPRDIFVIYRTNAQSRPIEEELLMRKIPHAVSSGVGFWTRTVVKDILSYLWMAEKPNDSAFMRVFNKGSETNPTSTRFLGNRFLDECKKRGDNLWDGMQVLETDPKCQRLWRDGIKDFKMMVGEIRDGMTLEDKLDISVRHYRSFFHREEGIDLEDDPIFDTVDSLCGMALKYDTAWDLLTHSVKMEEMQKRAARGLSNAVYLSTIHSAKGLEARACFGIGMSDSLLPHWASGGSQPDYGDGVVIAKNPWLPSAYPTSVYDERFCAYVLITRPIERLYLTWSATQGKKAGLQPSRFLEEMGVHQVREE